MDARIAIEALEVRASREGLEGPERALLQACEEATRADLERVELEWVFPQTADSRF